MSEPLASGVRHGFRRYRAMVEAPLREVGEATVCGRRQPVVAAAVLMALNASCRAEALSLVAAVMDELGLEGNAPSTRISLQRIRTEQIPEHVRVDACASPNALGVYWRSALIPRLRESGSS
jgi:hypothetical protein